MYICAAMKTMCPLGYHHNPTIAHPLGHIVFMIAYILRQSRSCEI